MWMNLLQNPWETAERDRSVKALGEAFKKVWSAMWTNGGCLMVIGAFALLVAISVYWHSKKWIVQYRYKKDEEWETVTLSSFGPSISFSIEPPRIGPAIYKGLSNAKGAAALWKRDHEGAEVRVVSARKYKE